MDSTDFIRIFPVYILVYMNRINYMYKGTPKLRKECNLLELSVG